MVFFVKTYAERTSRQNRTDLRSWRHNKVMLGSCSALAMLERYQYCCFLFSQMKDMSAEGILRPETKCWAQGMDGWRPLQSIPQLKWYLLATGSAVMNETDLAVLILNMLIKICEFYPNRYKMIVKSLFRELPITRKSVPMNRGVPSGHQCLLLDTTKIKLTFCETIQRVLQHGVTEFVCKVKFRTSGK